MGDFGHFLRLFDQRIHSKVDIGLIFIENVKFRLTLHIKLVSFKNITIFTQFMGQNISYLVRIPKYGHIVFCS